MVVGYHLRPLDKGLIAFWNHQASSLNSVILEVPIAFRAQSLQRSDHALHIPNVKW